ncbi:argininosuccinate lyase [Eudoraea chungangensis]|uniref:argininosuccinate lyase n=1 Tax=Eudoraea chungangensis TaxID=1481905 RepID=UPI0023EB66C1|nr:argininosuccinate lyase [Eudoraea chungangensis]
MKLWDKGFSTDKKIDHFTVGNDRELDLLLAKHDVEASLVHAKMLEKIGIITKKERIVLTKELKHIGTSVRKGEFTIEDEFEDVHSKIEFLLTQKLGDIGKKIHTARSRNDQVLVAMQLYIKEELTEIKSMINDLFELLIKLASRYQNILLPGYTHLQIAMPSSFGLWFSSYAESLIDDVFLVNAAVKITNQNPLGSAAGYGSSFPIDRKYTTKQLGFETMKYNVVAAQMGRGKVEKSASFAISSIGSTIGKMAMDICLYMNQNFNFISFPDSLTTGSSIMPHKKNPDVFELIRAKCNSIQAIPNQINLITTNLPSGYHRDLQAVKPLMISCIQDIKSCLEMLHFSLENIQVNKDILSNPMYDYLFSVDTLNELVLSGMPFRDAYKKMGEDIASNQFVPKRDIQHSHEGSIGNLCLEEVSAKMKNALK